MSTRRFAVLALLVTLLVAGVASYYASTRPDGLNSVASEQGFSQTQRSSPTAEGPLAGYQTRGLGDGRLSGGLAGVAGVALVLAIGSGLFWVVRRPRDTGPVERER